LLLLLQGRWWWRGSHALEIRDITMKFCNMFCVLLAELFDPSVNELSFIELAECQPVTFALVALYS